MRLLLVLALVIFSCKPPVISEDKASSYVVVLGLAQDAGYPQIACGKKCCRPIWHDRTKRKMVSCLGVVDQGKTYLFDATPDLKDQMQFLKNLSGLSSAIPDGIFLTHAHMGHYTGLMQLGREALGADKVPVYGMSRMNKYLTDNGPWSQLVELENIKLHKLVADSLINLSETLSVIPFTVPHRDEFSETVGYKIIGSKATILFIPDIDKWNKWDRDINLEIAKVDYAFLDGTFYANGEIIGRDMSEIPHPFIEESIKQFEPLPLDEKRKISFIHLNHTNPLLDANSATSKEFAKTDFNVAYEGQLIKI